ncbi:hypothetical protein MBANPS3_000911 [Mucor bainieri]
MAVATQDIKISCHNSVIKGHGAKSNDGHPWRNWKITLVAMDGEREVKGKLAMILDHVEYILHPTFEEPRRVKKEEPYVLQEKGWGEFDMRVVLYFTDNITDPQVLLFDLNFALPNYSITHSVEFPNASPELVKLLSRDPSSASVSAILSAASTPRKGGKKPAPITSDSRQAKKKPISSSPHSKTAKKAKPDTKSTTSSSSRKSRKSSTSSSSPAPAHITTPVVATPQSPVYDHPSPSDYSTHSSPSLIATSTPDLHPVDTEEDDNDEEEQEEQEEAKALHSRSSSDSSSNRLVDHAYKIADVYNLNPIHHAKLDKQIRDKWNIPDINMMELAKRIYRMSPEQTIEFRNMIFDNTPETIKTVTDPDGSIGIDLYSLGKPLLEKLWDFLADMASDDNESFTSQDHHESDLEFDSDAEQGEYKSDDNGHSHDTDMDEPGFFQQSDMESDYTDTHINHKQTNGYHHHPHYTHPNSTAADTENGYHDNSDMDIQDDDDY